MNILSFFGIITFSFILCFINKMNLPFEIVNNFFFTVSKIISYLITGGKVYSIQILYSGKIIMQAVSEFKTLSIFLGHICKIFIGYSIYIISVNINKSRYLTASYVILPVILTFIFLTKDNDSKLILAIIGTFLLFITFVNNIATNLLAKFLGSYLILNSLKYVLLGLTNINLNNSMTFATLIEIIQLSIISIIIVISLTYIWKDEK